MDFQVRFKSQSRTGEYQQWLLIFLAASIVEESPALRRPRPEIFTGGVAQPLVFRDLLLFLRDIVQSRFYRPDLWRYMDPVMTSGHTLLRCECFSSCASVYGRVDLTPAAFADGQFHRDGTTNVDLNDRFVQNLSSLRPGKKAHFEMGATSIKLTTHQDKTIEHKVKLPDRWIKGFLQIQAIQRNTDALFEIDGQTARQMLHKVPAGAKGTMTLIPTRGRPQVLERRVSSAQGGITLSGGHRLRLLGRVLPHVQSLRVYQVADTGASLWVAETPVARCSLALSGSVQKGFSGEGDALRQLQTLESQHSLDIADQIARQLNNFTIDDFAEVYDTPAADALEMVDRLSSQGLLGFDRDANRYFYRVLPFVPTLRMAPRVEGARGVVAMEGVEVESCQRDQHGVRAEGWVKGNQGTYHVMLLVDSAGYLKEGKCTCQWVQRHGLKRGPCKHLLALRFAVSESPDRSSVSPDQSRTEEVG